MTCTVSEGSGFKSVVGNLAFTEGNKYYFEIYVIKGSLIKIGVTKSFGLIEEAFSDNPKGWAIYNGEVRHNSNASGKKYGSQITAGDTIGVMINMIDGTLSFSKNGQNFGVAFTDEELKKGELFAACAPIYKNDSFCLKMMIRED